MNEEIIHVYIGDFNDTFLSWLFLIWVMEHFKLTCCFDYIFDTIIVSQGSLRASLSTIIRDYIWGQGYCYRVSISLEDGIQGERKIEFRNTVLSQLQIHRNLKLG